MNARASAPRTGSPSTSAPAGSSAGRPATRTARLQAAVFYHLAPEVAFRRFVLGESPESIEGRFKTPLGLAEQLLLRAGFELVDGTTATPAGVAPQAGRATGARR